MSCIMKYRQKDSNKEWQYYEAGDAKYCTDYLISNEYEEDYEYEIYEFLKDGIVCGIDSEYDFESEETIKEFLFRFYDCKEFDMLKCRCPIDFRLLDLDSLATDDFKKAVIEIEEKENKDIFKVIEERDKHDNGKRYKYVGSDKDDDLLI